MGNEVPWPDTPKSYKGTAMLSDEDEDDEDDQRRTFVYDDDEEEEVFGDANGYRFSPDSEIGTALISGADDHGRRGY